MKRLVLVCLLLVLFTGCARKDSLPKHYGKEFTVQKKTEIDYLNKYSKKLIAQKTPVKITGKIRFRDKILGSWAFVDVTEDEFAEENLIFINFSAVSQNITLPPEQRGEEIMIEGILVKDDTVLSGYSMIPYGYEFVVVTNNRQVYSNK